MPKHYKRKTNKRNWTKEQLQAALDVIRDEGIPIRVAARRYGIPESTLRDKLKPGVELFPNLGRRSTFTASEGKSWPNIKRATKRKSSLFCQSTHEIANESQHMDPELHTDIDIKLEDFTTEDGNPQGGDVPMRDIPELPLPEAGTSQHGDTQLHTNMDIKLEDFTGEDENPQEENVLMTNIIKTFLPSEVGLSNVKSKVPLRKSKAKRFVGKYRQNSTMFFNKNWMDLTKEKIELKKEEIALKRRKVEAAERNAAAQERIATALEKFVK